MHMQGPMVSVSGYQHREKNGIVTKKYLVCSCEGNTKQKKKGTEIILNSPSKDDLIRKMKTKFVPITRCDCKARIRIKTKF